MRILSCSLINIVSFIRRNTSGTPSVALCSTMREFTLTARKGAMSILSNPKSQMRLLKRCAAQRPMPVVFSKGTPSNMCSMPEISMSCPVPYKFTRLSQQFSTSGTPANKLEARLLKPCIADANDGVASSSRTKVAAESAKRCLITASFLIKGLLNNECSDTLDVLISAQHTPSRPGG